jgi:hypothetical protein
MPTPKENLDRWARMQQGDAEAKLRRAQLSAAATDDARLLQVIRGKFPGLSTAQLIAAFELLDTGNATEQVAMSAHLAGNGTWKAYLPSGDVEVTDAN